MPSPAPSPDPRAAASEAPLALRLVELGQRLVAAKELDDVIRETATCVRRDLGFGRCALLLDDRGVGVLTVQGWDGYEAQSSRSLAALRMAALDPLPALASARGKVVHRHDAPIAELATASAVLALQSFVAVPLRGGGGEPLGVIVAGHPLNPGVTPVLDADGPAARALDGLAALAGTAISARLAQRALGQARRMLENKKREMIELMRELKEREATVVGDLMQAQRFQQSIMPRPTDLAGATVEALYLPLEMVGGDLYDVAAVDGSRLRVFLADATGHGITAALATMFIKSEYEIVKRTVKGPAGVLRVLNERIARTYQQLGMRFTALCLSIDLRSGTLSWASAAHPFAFVVRGGGVISLEGGGTFLGVAPDVAFEERRLPLARGDGVYAFTDGLTEAWDARGEAFGEDRLQAAVKGALASGKPAAAAVAEALDRFVGAGRPKTDDVTFVGVRWTGPPAV